jgi:hypothetical protein
LRRGVAAQNHCITASLHHCITASLHHCITASLHHRHDGSEPDGDGRMWEAWRDKTSGEERRTCAVLTCGPNAVVGDVHNRMPCILGESDWANGSAESPPPRTNCWRCCGAAPAHHARAFNRRLPNARMDGLALPSDVAWHAHID